ncbi:MAG: iron-containing alcohol dehydrogenase [Clostridiales Family XIII bacterium]|nr:iron-containing alcohol dehydrogenase [Clostridiales Family XIII bacterium]
MYRNVAQIPLDYTLFKGGDTAFNWSPPGSIIFGNGVVKRIGEEVKRLGASNVVITTDEGLVKFGVVAKVTESLDAAGVKYVVFDKCEADPSVETVEAVAELAKDADMLIGVGGGSSIDPSKAASILVTNGGNIRDYSGCDLYSKAPLPVVAVPTASGTGAETSTFAVITDRQAKVKMAIGGSFNIPSLAICDPELTASLPPLFTAATGMDALCHAAEGYMSRSSEPISDAINSQAIKLIGGSVRRATLKGEYDREARYNMMLGSTMAGFGFVNTILGLSHAMAPPLGAHFHVPHGVANAICLPLTVEFNRPANPEKIASIADLLGYDVRGMHVLDAASVGVKAIYDLLDDLPIPPLSTYGVTEDDIDLLAGEAIQGGDLWTSPRAITLEQMKEIFKAALKLKAV